MARAPLSALHARLLRLALIVALASLLGACTAIKNANSLAEQHQALLDRQQPNTEQPAINNRKVHLDMIKTMQTRSLHFASLAHIDAHEAEHGATPELIRLRADALRATGQTETARNQYRRLLATTENAAARHGLGLLAAQGGDHAQAVAHLRESTRLDPLNASALSDLGYAFLLQGDTDAARVPLIQALELAPDNRKVISNLTLYLLVAGEQEKAETLMQRSGVSQDIRQGIAQHAHMLQTRMAQPLANESAASSFAANAGNGMQLRLQTTLAPSVGQAASQ